MFFDFNHNSLLRPILLFGFFAFELFYAPYNLVYIAYLCYRLTEEKGKRVGPSKTKIKSMIVDIILSKFKAPFPDLY